MCRSIFLSPPSWNKQVRQVEPCCMTYQTGGACCMTYQTGGACCTTDQTGGACCTTDQTGGALLNNIPYRWSLVAQQIRQVEPYCTTNQTGRALLHTIRQVESCCTTNQTGGALFAHHQTGGAAAESAFVLPSVMVASGRSRKITKQESDSLLKSV